MSTKGDKRKFRTEDLILKVTANIDPKKVTREAVFHGKDVNYDEIDRLQHRFHQALGRRPSEEWATG